MPELPEVETTRAGIAPHIQGKRVTRLVVRQRRLRWPIPRSIDRDLPGVIIREVTRRAKYILLQTDRGSAILHLGMSGSLRILTRFAEPQKHDHVDICFPAGVILRFNDPRRFGSLLWTRRDPLRHPLLAKLGPEPMEDAFTGHGLWQQSRNRKLAVKAFIMDAKIVVGVGNIYASEALFRAGIHPRRAAGKISLQRYETLASEIRSVLGQALKAGGTTLRNFTDSDGLPGYFSQSLAVYGRADQPCTQCGAPIRQQVIGQRSTYYCVHCQR